MKDKCLICDHTLVDKSTVNKNNKKQVMLSLQCENCGCWKITGEKGKEQVILLEKTYDLEDFIEGKLDEIIEANRAMYFSLDKKLCSTETKLSNIEHEVEKQENIGNKFWEKLQEEQEVTIKDIIEGEDETV